MVELPLFEFFKINETVPDPKRADPLVLGTLPQRAAQFCEPVVAASGYGWNISPPIDFDVLWDGIHTYWRGNVSDPWIPLKSTASLPQISELVGLAPEGFKALLDIPFLARAPEPGIIQIWSGLVVRSSDGWASHISPLTNYPKKNPVEVYEGIIDTSWWFGPLITPLRILKTDQPIEFRRSSPYCQVKPLRKDCYSRETLNNISNDTIASKFTAKEWEQLARSLLMRNKDNASKGSYRKEANNHRKCPVKNPGGAAD